MIIVFNIQDKILEEIHAVTRDRNILPSDIQLLKYMDRVIKESLRLFPPGPIMLRSLEEDITIGNFIY